MIICADDFGMAEDINRCIVELCGLGKLTAVSCMVALPQCTATTMRALLPHQHRVDIGLHLYLAETKSPLAAGDGERVPASVPSYKAFLWRALSGRVRPEHVATQVSEQYELFLEKSGRPPDFIDGHLHVHQLPGVREGLLQFALSLPASSRPYIRNTQMDLQGLIKRGLPWLKALPIGKLGAAMLKKLCDADLATNRGFAGVYEFARWPRFPFYLPRFLECLSADNAMLVTHPGRYEEWRLQEYETLRVLSFPKGGPNRFLRT